MIGKRGAEVDKLRDELAMLTNSEISVNVEEIKRPEVDARLVAENVAHQLRQRISFRRAMKRAMQAAIRSGAEGIKIQTSGRLGGAEIARTAGLTCTITPATDGRLRTVVETGQGAMAFQEYFVKHRCEPVATAVRFEDGDGRDTGSAGVVSPSPRFLEALDAASALVYCPSNPFLSIAPILGLEGIRDRIGSFPGPPAWPIMAPVMP